MLLYLVCFLILVLQKSLLAAEDDDLPMTGLAIERMPTESPIEEPGISVVTGGKLTRTSSLPYGGDGSRQPSQDDGLSSPLRLAAKPSSAPIDHAEILIKQLFERASKSAVVCADGLALQQMADDGSFTAKLAVAILQKAGVGGYEIDVAEATRQVSIVYPAFLERYTAANPLHIYWRRKMEDCGLSTG